MPQVFIDNRERSSVFTFDGVFGPSATQADVYASLAAPLLVDVLDGWEGAILAYGQTGSGKTYSLLHMGGGDASSPEGDAGLFPRLAADLFTAIEADFRHVYAVEVAFYQVYNEVVDDLLRPSGTNLKVRAEADGAPAAVDGLHWAPVRSAAGLLEAFRAGRKRLVYGAGTGALARAVCTHPWRAAHPLHPPCSLLRSRDGDEPALEPLARGAAAAHHKDGATARRRSCAE